MTDLSKLARRWMRQSEMGRGIKLSAADHDLLNAIGVGELLAAEAARLMREQSQQRAHRIMPAEESPSNDSTGKTTPANIPSSRLSGKRHHHDADAAAARVRRQLGRATKP